MAIKGFLILNLWARRRWPPADPFSWWAAERGQAVGGFPGREGGRKGEGAELAVLRVLLARPPGSTCPGVGEEGGDTGRRSHRERDVGSPGGSFPFTVTFLLGPGTLQHHGCLVASSPLS